MAQPSSKTVKRLFAVSGNRCAFPDCEATLVDEQSGVVTAEICHIKARSPKGPRYDPSQSDEQRHGYDNLILMCGDHNKVIDDDAKAYTVARLHRIKAEHEEEWKAKPGSAPQVTDEMIRRIIERIAKPSPRLIDFQLRIQRARARKDSELALLDPYRQATRLVGRKRDLKDLLDWAGSAKPVAVRTIVGGAGAGKTRLALELMQKLSNRKGGGKAKAAGAWEVGFLTADEMSRFRSQHGLADWSWDRPTLMVVDYAAGAARELRGWLDELADHPTANASGSKDKRPPLRILLLERDASTEAGWLANLMPKTHSDAGIANLLDPAAPVPLAAIDSAGDRRALLQNMLALCGKARKRPPLDLPAPGKDQRFDSMLAQEQWSDPLYLMMAAVVAIDTGVPSALSLTRPDLGERVAGREIGRIEKLAGRDNEAAGLMVLLAGCATLARGLDADQALAMARSLLEITGREYPGGPGKLADDTSTALAGPDRGIAAVVPDMVGEAFVLLSLAGGLSDHQRNRLLLAAAGLAPASLKTLVLLIQDYGRRHPQTLQWLDGLIAPEAGADAGLLRQLSNQMPHQTVVLREMGAKVSAMLAEADRKAAKTDPSEDNLARLAISLNNLGLRLSDLGRREEALKTAAEAVKIYRRLSDRRPDAFEPDLAMSLNNLAPMLSELGRGEEALKTAQEAVEIHRRLSDRRPDAFEPGLAASLSNLATMLSELGRREEALKNAQEAVEICRRLSARRPDAFEPDLARSLGVLSLCRKIAGEDRQAKEAIEEALTTLRPLFLRLPAAFAPLMARICREYLAAVEALDEEPDQELLGPVLEALKKLKHTEGKGGG